MTRIIANALLVAAFLLSSCDDIQTVLEEASKTKGEVVRVYIDDGRLLDCISVSTTASGTVSGSSMSSATVSFTQLVACEYVPQ